MSALTRNFALGRPREGQWRRLFIIVAMVMLVQIIGGILTASSVQTWYPTLEKAAWNPPAWLFGPVWSMLYALMAWAGWRVWQRLLTQGVEAPWKHPALRAFALQLALNLGWSAVFFGLRAPLPALIEMVALFASILWMLQQFRRVELPVFYSQLPYAAWVAFAFTLNAAIVVLNG